MMKPTTRAKYGLNLSTVQQQIVYANLPTLKHCLPQLDSLSSQFQDDARLDPPHTHTNICI